jgi:hypothetical protein
MFLCMCEFTWSDESTEQVANTFEAGFQMTDFTQRLIESHFKI